MRRSTPLRPFLALTGGWVVIFTPATLSLSLRMREYDSGEFLEYYPTTLAIGWLTLMIALLVFGWSGDRMAQQSGTRAPIFRAGVILLALGGLCLAVAPSTLWISLVWVALQIPGAMVISAALAMGASASTPQNRGIMSGLLGASSIVALLLGSVVVSATATNIGLGIVIATLLGTGLAIPLMVTHEPSSQTVSPQPRSTVHIESPSAEELGQEIARRRRFILWTAFLVSSFLLSWGTSTANGFLVAFLEKLSTIPAGDLAFVSALAVAFASVAAIASSILSGMLGRSPRSAAIHWVVGAVITALAVALLANVPSGYSLYLIALVLGVGFGMANGVEVTLALGLRPTGRSVGINLSTLTSATTVPYVMVPAVAAVLLSTDTETGLVHLFTIAAVSVGLSALIFAAFLAAMRLPSGELHRTLQ